MYGMIESGKMVERQQFCVLCMTVRCLLVIPLCWGLVSGPPS